MDAIPARAISWLSTVPLPPLPPPRPALPDARAPQHQYVNSYEDDPDEEDYYHTDWYPQSWYGHQDKLVNEDVERLAEAAVKELDHVRGVYSERRAIERLIKGLTEKPEDWIR
jgi:hypothetical protein